VKTLLMLFSLLLPWPLRREILRRCFGYQIHSTARIGLAWVLPKRLVMDAGTEIGNLTVCKNLDLIHMHADSRIGRGNWITGFPSDPSPHFAHQHDRRPELILGEHSAITNRHLIDCTSRVSVGRFTTFAGFQSQILTHSIDLEACRQASEPVTIGDYCFVGTNCVLLGGSVLPSYSVLAAKSLLNKAFAEEYSIYGGIPAGQLKKISPDLGYFHRPAGMVD
jgi:acetyltransferase-like isoleucine patch superfamily enzyme